MATEMEDCAYKGGGEVPGILIVRSYFIPFVTTSSIYKGAIPLPSSTLEQPQQQSLLETETYIFFRQNIKQGLYSFEQYMHYEQLHRFTAISSDRRRKGMSGFGL